jgi:hypothetical protein
MRSATAFTTGAVVGGVDVHAERTRPMRHGDDVDDCGRDVGDVCVRWCQLA